MRLSLRESLRRIRPGGNPERLGDFTVRPRMILISLIAIGIGALSGFVSLALLRLIGLFTNLFFYQHWAFNLASPADNHLGLLEILVPVIGGVIVGFMARYGSQRIRGHGIPEALEVILINGSRIEPRVSVLKPLGSAIAIGSGGPFGAEGPIIVTGGALGSLLAQFLHLTNAERKTLLVAGAAGGMSATFGSPVAAVLLAVEILLFEWKPRSLIPVALASATAAAVRHVIHIGADPLFPTPPHASFVGPVGLIGCVIVGLAAGMLALILTRAVYAAEDGFRKLPIHWMWWPALGGVVVGIGGLIFPQALGVGYDVIGRLLQGNVVATVFLGILLVKSTIWVVALSSGTSGGILAPLLMMGAALGGMFGFVLPNEGAGFWPLVCMAAVLGGTMRAPLTGIVFAIELTHDVNMLLPLMLAVMIAHGFTVLMLKRSILTEKVARRGYHLSSEYAVDPLEILFVREAMRTHVVTLPEDTRLLDLTQTFRTDGRLGTQGLYPVVDGRGDLSGVLTRTSIINLTQDGLAGKDQLDGRRVADVATHDAIVAFPDEPLRAVAFRMAETGLTRLPVVERNNQRRVVGMISLRDLLVARARNLEDERRRERVLQLRMLLPTRMGGPPRRTAHTVESSSDR